MVGEGKRDRKNFVENTQRETKRKTEGNEAEERSKVRVTVHKNKEKRK